MSGVFLCASPFSQVTRLKVKKSDKFDIPSTFCDYLKRREKEKHQIPVFLLREKKRTLPSQFRADEIDPIGLCLPVRLWDHREHRHLEYDAWAQEDAMRMLTVREELEKLITA